jgi:hypothetical protein
VRTDGAPLGHHLTPVTPLDTAGLERQKFFRKGFPGGTYFLPSERTRNGGKENDAFSLGQSQSVRTQVNAQCCSQIVTSLCKQFSLCSIEDHMLWSDVLSYVKPLRL